MFSDLISFENKTVGFQIITKSLDLLMHTATDLNNGLKIKQSQESSLPKKNIYLIKTKYMS